VRHAKIIGRQRQRRRWRVSNKVKRYSTRPRLAVFRSHKHIYAQVIDDAAGRTLAVASSRDKELRESVKYGGNKNAAAAVGQAIAKRALAAGITQVALDRRDYRYHGRVAALADAARDAGLDLGAKKPQPEPKAEPEAKKPAKKPPKKAAASQGPKQ
jgi:large subunit ribosomal protein L18